MHRVVKHRTRRLPTDGGLAPAPAGGPLVRRWAEWLDRADVTVPPARWRVRVGGHWTHLAAVALPGVLLGVRTYFALAVEGPEEDRQGCYAFGLALLELAEKLGAGGKRVAGDLGDQALAEIFTGGTW